MGLEKINVIYGDQYIENFECFERGEEKGSMLGKKNGKGMVGQAKIATINLNPMDKIVGFNVKIAKDIHDPHALMIGQISFKIWTPVGMPPPVFHAPEDF